MRRVPRDERQGRDSLYRQSLGFPLVMVVNITPEANIEGVMMLRRFLRFSSLSSFIVWRNSDPNLKTRLKEAKFRSLKVCLRPFGASAWKAQVHTASVCRPLQIGKLRKQPPTLPPCPAESLKNSSEILNRQQPGPLSEGLGAREIASPLVSCESLRSVGTLV